MLGGVVAAHGEISLPAVLLVAWVAAALGDIASFALGARLGRRFIHTHGPRVGMTAPRVERVEHFYARHGAKAILVGRFVGIIRAVSPFLAGSSGLRFRAFLPWSLLGTAVWASAFTLVGYAFSESFSQGRRRAHPRRLRARPARRRRARGARAPQGGSLELIEPFDADLLGRQQRALDRAAEDPRGAVLVL